MEITFCNISYTILQDENKMSAYPIVFFLHFSGVFLVSNLIWPLRLKNLYSHIHKHFTGNIQPEST